MVVVCHRLDRAGDSKGHPDAVSGTGPSMAARHHKVVDNKDYPAGHLDWAAAASCQPRRQPAVDQGGGGTGLQGTGGSMDLAVFCSGRSTGREVWEAGRDREAAGAGAGSLSRLLAAAWGRRRDLGEDTRLALAAVQELPFR